MPIWIMNTWILKNEEVQDKEKQEHSCHKIALHCPCLAIAAEEHLSRANHDNQYSVCEHNRALGSKYLCLVIEQLLAWKEHTVVVHLCQQLMPCTEEANDKHNGKEHKRVWRELVKVQRRAIQAHEDASLNKMYVFLETSCVSHLTTKIRLHNPRKKEQSTKE